LAEVQEPLEKKTKPPDFNQQSPLISAKSSVGKLPSSSQAPSLLSFLDRGLKPEEANELNELLCKVKTVKL
jgi:hypothetical protein